MFNNGERESNDWAAGKICNDAGALLAKPRMAEDDSRYQSLIRKVEPINGSLSRMYDVGPTVISGREVTLNIYFYKKKISDAFIWLTKSQVARLRSKPSDDDEHLYVSWARAEVGHQKFFSWGTLFAGYDAKMAFNTIHFSYRRLVFGFF